MRTLSIPLTAAFLASALTACGGGPDLVAGGRELPVPDEPGVYALTADGDLHRLDGPPEWESQTWPQRSEFGPDVQFVVYEPDLAGSPAPARLWRVAWLRSEIQPTGIAGPRAGSEWVVADLESQSEPLLVTPSTSVPGLIHLAPARPLSPGLYEFAYTQSAGVRARVGVNWSGTDKRTYAAANCVDRIAGSAPMFQPCAGSPQAPAGGIMREASMTAPAPAAVTPAVTEAVPAAVAGPLKISLESPIRENGGWRVRGVIVNASAQMQPAPVLRGTILDAAGSPADHWYFNADDSLIAPGSEVSFTTWRRAPAGGSRLNVDMVER